jgi:hypothetical protein
LRVRSHLFDVYAVLLVHFDGHVGGQVEVGVERAGSVARLDGRGVRELPDVVCAGARVVETRLDTVAHGLNLGEGQVDLGENAGDVEALGV